MIKKRNTHIKSAFPSSRFCRSVRFFFKWFFRTKIQWMDCYFNALLCLISLKIT